MNKLFVEPSPHIRSGNTTQKIMLRVIIAMIPVLIASVYYYGLRALILAAVCSAACVLFEFLFNIVTKREQTVSDLSAIVTGLILAFNLPATLPLYMAVIGCFVAIVIVKMMFGGIGQNFANPALTARIVLTLSFTASMSAFPQPFYYKNTADAVSAVTPLSADVAAGDVMPSFMDLFLGNHAGSMGEVCSLAILIGFVYLLVSGLIHPVTPIAYVGTVALISLISGGNVVLDVFSGGLLFGAVFMATDYATTPITAKGKLIFGIGCGLITIVIRYFGSMPEGASFSILIMNILTPYIDKYTRPRPFGMKKEAKKNG